ncbi:MAG: Unknown protein [uncultured Sulfurovum sp.]|uniref:Uncharacterized protein n=1 Tax=uncultured Sulfurovum sp. TaxID=269237 RepID=A0A6S6THM0_9BACT|nr:MAG: Unknown protein [uncultured Sulfurovum sp.]
MKLINIKYLIALGLTAFMLFGCVKKEKVSSAEIENPIISSPNTFEYTQPSDEIQKFLSTTPIGAEVYLEEKESGEWYLKVEKTFTVQKDQEKTETIEPIYGESILI